MSTVIPHLFRPWQIGPLHLSNRIVIAPMCQYSAIDGNATDWHMMHVGQLAMSGAGLLILEATAVSPEGRISPHDLGLYSGANEAALARVLTAVRKHSAMPTAVQLAHAGRKASTLAPWEGGAQIPPDAPMGWKTVGPSAVPFLEHYDVPRALTLNDLGRIREEFAEAARRAARLGLDGVEVHSAHGYLLHQFLSPLSNHRTDAYGGKRDNRMRFPLEVFDSVRSAFPSDKAVWVRVSATDWVDGGWSLEDTIAYAKALQARGCLAIHVSSGGLSARQAIPAGPAYQVPLARRLKQEVGMPTMAVGLITEPAQAEAILEEGQADAVALARAMLYDPRWPWHAAEKLGAKVSAPPQYWRSPPHGVKGLFEDT